MFLIMCIAILSVWELYIRKKRKYIKIPFVTICGFFGIFAIVKLWQVFPLLGLYGVVIGIVKSFPINSNDKQYLAVIQCYVRKLKDICS